MKARPIGIPAPAPMPIARVFDSFFAGTAVPVDITGGIDVTDVVVLRYLARADDFCDTKVVDDS